MMRVARRHPLPIFLAATFGFSWGVWTLMILSQRGVLPFTVPLPWIGSFGPAAGALLAVGCSEGRDGLRSIGRRLLQWRTGPGVWAVALGGILIVEAAALALFGLLAGRVPALSPFSAWGTLLAYIPIILVIGGPLGEEPGWRGFLQPWLQSRVEPLLASGIVGVVWSVWHLPLLWLQGSAQEGGSFLGFALSVFPLAFVFAWVFNRSNGSLVLSLLLHTSINTVTFVVEPSVFGPLREDPLLSRCFIAMLWLTAAGLVLFSAPRSAGGLPAAEAPSSAGGGREPHRAAAGGARRATMVQGGKGRGEAETGSERIAGDAMPVKTLKEFLDGQKVKYVSISHSPAYTALEVAASAHVSGRELAKTVIIRVDGRMAMAVVPAASRVEFDLLAKQVGAQHVELAAERDFKDRFPECEVGAMPPFGNLYGMQVYVSDRLAEEDELAFTAGSHSEIIKLKYADFDRLVRPKKVSISPAR